MDGAFHRSAHSPVITNLSIMAYGLMLGNNLLVRTSAIDRFTGLTQTFCSVMSESVEFVTLEWVRWLNQYWLLATYRE